MRNVNVRSLGNHLQLKRLDSIARSPIYAHLNQCLDGLTSIRSYRAHERMWEQNAEKLDAQACNICLNTAIK